MSKYYCMRDGDTTYGCFCRNMSSDPRLPIFMTCLMGMDMQIPVVEGMGE